MRYAVYYIPAPGSALARIGASLLGYDVSSRADVSLPGHTLYRDADFAATLAAPRRYGFHATLKAPFELRPDVTEKTLRARVTALAARLHPVDLPGLEASALGSFVALTPTATPLALIHLAATCVTLLDDLRAPLSAADRERRLSARLTERQIAHVERYGYPYVLEDFRFHMTLTGPLAPAQTAPALAAIRELTRSVTGPLVVDALAIALQPSRDARFHVLQRIPLGDGSSALV